MTCWIRSAVAAVAIIVCACGEGALEVREAGGFEEDRLLESSAALTGQFEPLLSFDGLSGTFARYSYLAPSGEVTAVTFTTHVVEPDGDAAGAYVRKLKKACFTYGCNTERGSFAATRDYEPLFPPLITFHDESGAIRDHYLVLGAYRSQVTQRITALKLQKADSAAAEFTLTRIGL